MLHSFSAMAHRLLALLLITSSSSVSTLRSCNALQVVSESPGETELRTLLEKQEKAALARAGAVNTRYGNDDFVSFPVFAKHRVLQKFYGFEAEGFDRQTDHDRLKDAVLIEELPPAEIEPLLIQFLKGLWLEHVVLGWIRATLQKTNSKPGTSPIDESKFRTAFTDWNEAKENFWNAAQEFFPEAATCPAAAPMEGALPDLFDLDPDFWADPLASPTTFLAPVEVQSEALEASEAEAEAAALRLQRWWRRAEVLKLLAPVLEQKLEAKKTVQKLAKKEREARKAFAEAWTVYRSGRGREFQHLDLLERYESKLDASFQDFYGLGGDFMDLGIEQGSDNMKAWKREWPH